MTKCPLCECLHCWWRDLYWFGEHFTVTLSSPPIKYIYSTELNKRTENKRSIVLSFELRIIIKNYFLFLIISYIRKVKNSKKNIEKWFNFNSISLYAELYRPDCERLIGSVFKIMDRRDGRL